MSTSLLYHALGLRGYDYVKTDYQDGAVIFTLRQRRHTYRCPVCQSRDVHPRGHQERTFQTVPIGPKPVHVVLPIPRVECPRCGIIRQVPIPFADARRSYTRAFERYVVELGRLMTIQDVARHLQVGWDLVKDIQKRDLYRRFRKPRLRKLRLDPALFPEGPAAIQTLLRAEQAFRGNLRAASDRGPFGQTIAQAA